MTSWFLKSRQLNKNKRVSMDRSEQTIQSNDQPWLSTLIKIIPQLFYFLLFISFSFYVKHEITLIKINSQVSIEREADILSGLNDLERQVSAIQSDHQTLEGLKNKLTHLEETMVTEQTMSGLAKSTELQQVTAQLKQLQQTFKVTHPPLKKHTQTTESFHRSLPFQVQSIDIIAGQSFASITYHQDTLPLRLNDSLAGWTVKTVDYVTGIAVFENRQHRRVTIHVPRTMYA